MTRPRALRRALLYLRRGPRYSEGFGEESPRSRDWEDLYRERWQHDRVVRTTHGVNCTGSCSWQVRVKDGIVAFETQATDYPSLGPDHPEYEPRGCARGASFSWYEYSPLRIRHPYVRGRLLAAWRRLRAEGKDPLAAWGALAEDEALRSECVSLRGKGGLVRASWDEVTELIASALLYTVIHHGPDRVVGFSPIPAMSMVSYSAGTRFLSLLGGTILSFYDWYADLPIASPQVWGEQTDVPESADWYNTAYMLVWGTNLPMTRTPDAHFLVEARYRGTRVAAVSPDYAESVKFADLWLPARAGTDGALAMAMTHVLLKEFYVLRQVPYFEDYVRRFTDLPYLVVLEPAQDGHRMGAFLRASDLGSEEPLAAWRPLVWDALSDSPRAPVGSIADRWDGSGHWRLAEEDQDGHRLQARLTLVGEDATSVAVAFPYFGDGRGSVLTRRVPARTVVGQQGPLLVTTVFDLLLAETGARPDPADDAPADYDDPRPYTPAWQEAITGVDRALVVKVAREFGETAARTKGRVMIAMGAGINHWYHSDTIYRAILNLVLLTGSEGVNGGGWAHYVGQEKVRPLEGFGTLAFAQDWLPATRHMNGTSFFYFATDQFRYDAPEPGLVWPGAGRYAHLHPADMNALAVRLGWLPFYPQWRQNPLDVGERLAEAQDARALGQEVAARMVRGELPLAVEEPEAPTSAPRVLLLWRANLLGASGKGHEFFLRHLLGCDDGALTPPPHPVLEDVRLEAEPPRGRLDLFVDIDFRMNGSGLYADVVLPAATWYEKHDLSSTDMHPFVHPFNPVVSPPWEARSDWDTFAAIARAFSTLAARHLPKARDVLLVPLLHDTPGELAQPGPVRDWRRGEAEAIPGRTMANVVVVERDYAHLADQFLTLGPRAAERVAAKGVAAVSRDVYEELAHLNGCGVSGRRDEAAPPSLADGVRAANAILALSGATNGRIACREWQDLGQRTGLDLTAVGSAHEHVRYTLQDLTVQPRQALPTPVWSGLEASDRRYAPFTANVELGIPWRTLTGRQHVYLDHELLRDLGEALPLYRPPLTETALLTESGEPGRILRLITPHGKWGIHSTYTDTLPMLTLFRGGPTIWLSVEDAAALSLHDNDWVEVANGNGATVVRAVVSHRIPSGLAILYHAQDRTIAMPASPKSGRRGGTHNSLTRIRPKPSHMVGGYAQLSYGFNYIGPTGHQRDEVVTVRALKGVDWLEG